MSTFFKILTETSEDFPSSSGAEFSRAAQVVGNVAGGDGKEVFSKVRQTGQQAILSKFTVL